MKLGDKNIYEIPLDKLRQLHRVIQYIRYLQTVIRDINKYGQTDHPKTILGICYVKEPAQIKKVRYKGNTNFF